MTVTSQVPSAARGEEGQLASSAEGGPAPEEVREWPRKWPGRGQRESREFRTASSHDLSGHIWSHRGQEGKNRASRDLQNILPQVPLRRQGQGQDSLELTAQGPSEEVGKAPGPRRRG